MDTIVDKAMLFAKKAHGDQIRRYTKLPYITHPAELVHILQTLAHNEPSEEMLCAAWLHDVVEDTDCTLDDIRVEFGDKVAQYVYYLTDLSTKSDGNRVIRKAIDMKHISDAPVEVKTIKLADLISNSTSIIRYDKKFARTYINEKRLLLSVLQNGDKNLLIIATGIVSEWIKHDYV